MFYKLNVCLVIFVVRKFGKRKVLSEDEFISRNKVYVVFLLIVVFGYFFVMIRKFLGGFILICLYIILLKWLDVIVIFFVKEDESLDIVNICNLLYIVFVKVLRLFKY